MQFGNNTVDVGRIDYFGSTASENWISDIQSKAIYKIPRAIIDTCPCLLWSMVRPNQRAHLKNCKPWLLMWSKYQAGIKTLGSQQLCAHDLWNQHRELWNEFNIYLYMVNRYIQFACDIMLAVKGFLSITLLPLRNSHNMSFASMGDCISQIVYTDWDSCLSSTTIRFWKIFAQLQMRILVICIWRICMYFIEWISRFITHQFYCDTTKSWRQ